MARLQGFTYPNAEIRISVCVKFHIANLMPQDSHIKTGLHLLYFQYFNSSAESARSTHFLRQAIGDAVHRD